MSLIRYTLNPPRVAEGDHYPQCSIDDMDEHASVNGHWDGRIVVYGPSEDEARALARRIADLLNAHEELHRDS